MMPVPSLTINAGGKAIIEVVVIGASTGAAGSDSKALLLLGDCKYAVTFVIALPNHVDNSSMYVSIAASIIGMSSSCVTVANAPMMTKTLISLRHDTTAALFDTLDVSYCR